MLTQNETYSFSEFAQLYIITAVTNRIKLILKQEISFDKQLTALPQIKSLQVYPL